ncbi:MAG: hypothetical protein GY795_01720, partial [Desulfobacterales bacterium]|nr:hypothetical protein [Desulfobacterales bacterium]
KWNFGTEPGGLLPKFHFGTPEDSFFLEISHFLCCINSLITISLSPDRKGVYYELRSLRMPGHCYCVKPKNRLALSGVISDPCDPRYAKYTVN